MSFAPLGFIQYKFRREWLDVCITPYMGLDGWKGQNVAAFYTRRQEIEGLEAYGNLYRGV